MAEGILWVRLPLPMRLDHVNAYALDDGDGWTIVDTGFASRTTRELWERVLAGPLAGKPVRRVLVTHHHPDHVGLAGWFQRHGAELMMPRTGWLFARMLWLDEQPVPPAETLAFWRAAGMPDDALERRRRARPFNYRDVVAELPLGFTQLRDGDLLRVGGREWRVRFGQGHAPDHATLWGIGHDLVLCGDQILPSISPNVGVWATEPEANPLADWLAACERLSAAATDDHLALPGHQHPFRDVPARLAAFAAEHEARLERLGEWLTEPRNAVECFPPLFGRRVPDAEFGLALGEAVAHLNHLWKARVVTREMAPNGIHLWRRA